MEAGSPGRMLQTTATVKDAEGLDEDTGSEKGEEEKSLSDVSEGELTGLGIN